MRKLIGGVLASPALALALALAGCAAEPAVSPLPTDAGAIPPRSAPAGPASTPPVSTAPANAAPTSAAPASRKPGPPTASPRTTTTRPTAASSCRGAIVYTIDTTTDELALVPSLCLGVGAVLRIENIGPGEVTTDAPDLVDPNYEAGVAEIRFVRTGTVVVTIPQGGESYHVTVVVR